MYLLHRRRHNAFYDLANDKIEQITYEATNNDSKNINYQNKRVLCMHIIH